MDDLEGTKPKVEGIEPPSQEGAIPTLPKVEPTPKTYKDEADFQRAVTKGLESTTKQLDLQKAETGKAEAALKLKELDVKSLQEDITELEKLILLKTQRLGKPISVRRLSVRLKGN